MPAIPFVGLHDNMAFSKGYGAPLYGSVGDLVDRAAHLLLLNCMSTLPVFLNEATVDHIIVHVLLALAFHYSPATKPAGRMRATPCYHSVPWSLQVEYVAGVDAGYRHFDHSAGPFGFGLSDTSASFVDAPIDGAFTPEATESEVVAVSATVTNSSSAAGSETVQVDRVPPAEGVVTRRSLKALVSSEQLHLQPGQPKYAQLTFACDDAAYWIEGKA
ncbi:hypothetical protein SPBR_07786 [Sporothrix brasiliensis 5110]|uniref:beta-glucosidase n=1 Tax=Sporothrix brasiliensis 5110 TaxID=1398154 RepID=A0A0C2FDT8_9PEZI|nr:uncharacterized protein SPBR_07786 [Sporothrix brasiliensis 5110]KIH89293.1 hypothetical protein SPBR_07786 [Sporothrix brasiliensis 5110]